MVFLHSMIPSNYSAHKNITVEISENIVYEVFNVLCQNMPE